MHTINSPRPHRFLSLFFTTLLALLGAASSSAQTVFTFTATADYGADSAGYTVGSSYTFIFTSAASFSNSGDSVFDSTSSKWVEQLTTQDQMWISIGGTGLLGAYVRPTADALDPNSSIKNDTSGNLDIWATADTSTSVGLATLNHTSLIGLEGAATILPTFSSATGSYAEPFNSSAGYFASSFLGSYSSSNGGTVKLFDQGWATVAQFTVTGLTISAAAVPEPSTYAALAGLAALGFVAYRRHKRTTAV